MKYFDNIIGYEHVKYELSKIIDCLNNKEKYEKLGVKTPKNLFLFGKAGVGKTLFASAFIEALNRKKYIIRKTKSDVILLMKLMRLFGKQLITLHQWYS